VYTKLAKMLSVVQGTDQFSAAVTMQGANCVQCDCVLAALASGATSLTITVQESNDGENWTDVANGSSAISAVGYSTVKLPTSGNIASAWVRLKYSTAGSGGKSIFSAGLNTAMV